jgi:hypothetical protein
VNRSIPTPQIACNGRVGSRYLTMKGSYAARTVTCSGVMPGGTAGDRFIGAIEASAGGYRSLSSFLISVDP